MSTGLVAVERELEVFGGSKVRTEEVWGVSGTRWVPVVQRKNGLQKSPKGDRK